MFTRRRLLAATGAAALAPAVSGQWTPGASATGIKAPETCELILENRGGSPINAYITGREFGTDRWTLVRADSSKYHLENPSEPHTPLPVDCAIPVGASTRITLPRMYGARIYFVENDTLAFYVNPGPALVEPAFVNPADENFHKIWSFCEFTFNDFQIFVNISYVDLVTALPIGLTLEGDATTTVAPLPDGAVDAIAADLRAQQATDGHPWGDLVLSGDGGGVLRAISPQNLGGDRFSSLWTPYVDAVWDRYRSTDLRVDVQGGGGVYTGRVVGDVLTFTDGHTFSRPTTTDIFTCNSGPFANDPADPDPKKAILARLAAAFNRSTVLDIADQPNGATAADYYRTPITNHYSRIVHANSPIGYAFPYDDVRPDGRPDESGAAHDGNPRRLTVSAG